MENLEVLYERKNDAYNMHHEQELKVLNLLTTALNEYCKPEGVEIIVNLSFDTPWSTNSEKGRFGFTGSIYFKTDDATRIAKGFDYDFGSDFTLCIYEHCIEINKGTCGSYSRKNKFQVARDFMVVNIWKNEERLCEIVRTQYDYELYKNYEKLDFDYRRAKEDIENQKRDAKRQAALTQLKNAKYFYQHSKQPKYENDDYWTRKVIGTKHNFYDIFVITKVTDKNVLGYYLQYRWENKRLNLNDIVNRLMNGAIECGEIIPENYTVLNELPLEEAAD